MRVYLTRPGEATYVPQLKKIVPLYILPVRLMCSNCLDVPLGLYLHKNWKNAHRDPLG